MDDLPIILSSVQPMTDKVFRIFEDAIPMPTETQSCLLQLRELGVPVYKRLQDGRNIICIHKPTNMSSEAHQQWSILESYLGQPVFKTSPSLRPKKASFAEDNLGYGKRGGDNIGSQQVLEKYAYNRTRDELTNQKTLQSLVLDDHKDGHYFSLIEIGGGLNTQEVNLNYQKATLSPQIKQVSVYKKHYSGAYCHQSTSAMERANFIPGPVDREVKTWYQLPQYAMPESPIETLTPSSAILKHVHIPPVQQVEVSNVVVINNVDPIRVPNGLKGIHNLFSNYGNVDKVVYNSHQANCLVYFQTAIGAAIAQRELSALDQAIEEFDVSMIICSNQFGIEADATIYVPDIHHARFKNKVPTIVNSPGRTIHFSIFGLGDHIVATKSLERFLQQRCYPLRVKRESKDQNMWFIELQSVQAACATLMRLHDESFIEGGYIRVSFTKTRQNAPARALTADEFGTSPVSRKNRK